VPTLYSYRFLQGVGVSTGISMAVPAGYRGVVRCADVYSPGTLSGFQWYLEGAAGQTFWSYHETNPVGDSRQWTGRQVLFAGETLSFRSDSPVDVTVSGYLLVDV
jgi:hypothetical protein